jgi:hypothetical protein
VNEIEPFNRAISSKGTGIPICTVHGEIRPPSPSFEKHAGGRDISRFHLGEIIEKREEKQKKKAKKE